jgi:molybdopterin molybdotransferase
MLTVADALEAVRRHASPLAPRVAPLGELLGLRLAEDVSSGIDSPPFDKALVDGFAIATGDAAEVLRVTEVVTAGAVPTRRVDPGTTIRVMTGAPLPAGADAVVKWEDCQEVDDSTVRNPAALARPGQAVLRRGASFQRGQIVLARGKRLGPLDVALLAEIGQAVALVHRRPRVGVLATGDELVAADESPGPGQIRNSNGPLLLAAVTAAGATAVDLGVARDELDDLRAKMGAGLECDVLLVSGGVSAGIKDLVPGVLAGLGANEVFHQVRMKPGKPLWFGVREGGGGRTLAFGLPGNPVSTFVSFKLFVEPALAALGGGEFAPARTERGALAAPLKHRGQRPTYQPCRTRSEAASAERRVVEALDWKGSADVATLTRADCLAALPAGDYDLAAGAEVEVIAI